MTQVPRVAVVFVMAAVLLAGCRVDARVDIVLRSNGSGTLRTTLTIDADAMQRLGSEPGLRASAPVNDLRGAGWTVSGWKPAPTGTRSITFTHDFANQAELVARMHDLAGTNGMLRSPKITRDRNVFWSNDGIAVVVDLHAPSTGILTDAALAARLKAAGLNPATLDAQLSQQLLSAVHLSVTVHLPGGDTKTFEAVNGKLATVRVSQARTQWDRVVKVGLALSLALLAALFLSAAAVGRRRELRRRRQRISTGRVAAERTPLM